MKYLMFAMISLVLLLSGCSSVNQPHQNANIPAAAPISNYNHNNDLITNPQIISQQTDYSQYYHNLNILRVYGVDRERIAKIIYSINPQYFEGISAIDAINSKQELRQRNGVYYPDSQKITLYIEWESDEWLKYNLLHELKHHYCYITTSNAEYNHTGCFLNTPIDREYGFIQ